MPGRTREPVEEGAAIRQRQILIDLPDVLTMVAELKVHEAQVNNVAVDQRATIEIEALPEQAFTGRVSWVAALPDSAQMFMNNDLKVYRTTVILDGENDRGLLKPGMTATVEIHVGVLPDVLNIPMTALERQGNVHYVWQLTDQRVVDAFTCDREGVRVAGNADQIDSESQVIQLAVANAGHRHRGGLRRSLGLNGD